jgi:hypothetical protein
MPFERTLEQWHATFETSMPRNCDDCNASRQLFGCNMEIRIRAGAGLGLLLHNPKA